MNFSTVGQWRRMMAIAFVVFLFFIMLSCRYGFQRSVAFPEAKLAHTNVHWSNFPYRVGVSSEFLISAPQGLALRWYEERLDMSAWRPLQGSTCQGARSERNYGVIQIETLVIVCQDKVMVTRVLDFILH